MNNHTIASKYCPGCQQDKPATTEYFAKNRTTKSGLKSHCKACVKIRHDPRRKAEYDRRYREENQERIREQKKRDYEEKKERRLALNPKRKIDRAEAWRRYYAENRDKIRERARQWKLDHPEQARENERLWRLRNIERHRLNNRKTSRAYVARKYGAVGDHTTDDIKRQHKAQKGKCYYCGIKVGKNYHVEHVIPLSRGGSDGPENIVIACQGCNCSKGDKLPSEWDGSNRLL
jgi:5-methylcytosine-specific restriction endonuclease McrA